MLENKRRDGSKVPHKIIAVACSIDHAEQIKQLYVEKGYRAEVIHSRQTPEVQNEIKQDIENHRLDVIMLAMYFNTYLRSEIGKKREEWKVSDFDIAFEKLAVAEEFVEKILIEYLRLDEEEY